MAPAWTFKLVNIDAFMAKYGIESVNLAFSLVECLDG